jgi:RimJ/RimL family protein N-acetyltransferase
MNQVGDQIFTTERLQLRQFQRNDAESFYRMNLDPEVIKYTGDRSFDNVDQAREFLDNYDAYDRFGYGRWAIIESNSNQFIGFCGFKYHQEGYVDLGFRVMRQEWNKGYATEAAQGCLRYGFDKLNFKFVVGRVAKENSASIRVLTKIGMSFWKHGPCDGIENALYYRIDQEDFQNI